MTLKGTMLLRAAGAVMVVGAATGGSAWGAVLTGAGSHLPIPSPNPGEPLRQGRAVSGVTAAGWDGTWTPPAQSPWVGTFTAKGPIPAGSSNPAGTTRYDFTTLTNGSLPIGTYFAFGDVDTGAGVTEQFILTAFDAAGAAITTEWLDEPFGVSGTGISSITTPGWEWNAGTSQYTIDGTTVTSTNPSLTMWLENNQQVYYMEVVRTAAFANFSLSAPLVPGPGAASLLAIGAGALVRRRRR